MQKLCIKTSDVEIQVGDYIKYHHHGGFHEGQVVSWTMRSVKIKKSNGEEETIHPTSILSVCPEREIIEALRRI